MNIPESNKYPSESFCSDKKAEYDAWIAGGGEGADPSGQYTEIRGDFVFVPKVIEPEHVDTQEELDLKRINEIKSVLLAIDQKSIRALREVDQTRIDDLELEAVALREEMALLIA